MQGMGDDGDREFANTRHADERPYDSEKERKNEVFKIKKMIESRMAAMIVMSARFRMDIPFRVVAFFRMSVRFRMGVLQVEQLCAGLRQRSVAECAERDGKNDADRHGDGDIAQLPKSDSGRDDRADENMHHMRAFKFSLPFSFAEKRNDPDRHNDSDRHAEGERKMRFQLSP